MLNNAGMEPHIEAAFSRGIFAITLITHDLPATMDFYGHKLGLMKVHGDEVSAVYQCGGTYINILAESAAPALLDPAPLPDWNTGTRAVYTLDVIDVDACAASLQSAGVQLLNGPMDRPWGIRTASFQDPGGHIWEIANHSSN